MKTIKLLAVLLFSVMSTFAQENKQKVVAVVTKANWCPACVQNGERVMNEVLSKVNTKKVAIVSNDLTDQKTKMSSNESLKQYGINNLDLKETAVISFVDTKTKKVVKSISITKSSKEILKEFTANY